jgi:hypothetical protein
LVNGAVKAGNPTVNIGDKKSSLESKSVSWSNCDSKSQSSPNKLSRKSSQESESGSECEQRERRNGRKEFQSKGNNPAMTRDCQNTREGNSVDILTADSVAMENLENKIRFQLHTPSATEGQILMLNRDGDVDYKVADIFHPDINNGKESLDQDKKESKLTKNSSLSDFRPDMSEVDETQTASSGLDLPASVYKKEPKKESESDSERAESDSEVRPLQGLRRRKARMDDSSESGASYCRPRRQTKDTKMSRKEREVTPNPDKDDGNKVSIVFMFIRVCVCHFLSEVGYLFVNKIKCAISSAKSGICL